MLTRISIINAVFGIGLLVITILSAGCRKSSMLDPKQKSNEGIESVMTKDGIEFMTMKGWDDFKLVLLETKERINGYAISKHRYLGKDGTYHYAVDLSTHRTIYRIAVTKVNESELVESVRMDLQRRADAINNALLLSNFEFPKAYYRWEEVTTLDTSAIKEAKKGVIGWPYLEEK